MLERMAIGRAGWLLGATPMLVLVGGSLLLLLLLPLLSLVMLLKSELPGLSWE